MFFTIVPDCKGLRATSESYRLVWRLYRVNTGAETEVCLPDPKQTCGAQYQGYDLITARVRSTKEGTVFTGVCLLTFRGGGYPVPGLGGTPSQVWGGYPIPGLDRGIPHPRSGKGGGVIPSQVWTGVSHPRSGWGIPHPRSGWGGTPSQVWMIGIPSQIWMGGTPCQSTPPARSGWGTPPS